VFDYQPQDLEAPPAGLESYRRWYDYSRARDEMFKATDKAWVMW
jgi:polyphosphate kinase